MTEAEVARRVAPLIAQALARDAAPAGTAAPTGAAPVQERDQPPTAA